MSSKIHYTAHPSPGRFGSALDPRCTQCGHDISPNDVEIAERGILWVDDKPYHPSCFERQDHLHWRPIETAPRDGTVIDVWLGQAGEPDIAFYCTAGTRRSPGWSWRGDRFRPLGGLPGFEMMTTFAVPTHWMPLPRPPV